MSQLTRIIYISRSTFKSSTSNTVIEPNVGRILAQSRINNHRNGLVGVLYFGDGCFFQCLEGEESAVSRLYERLKLDKRHKDIKLISQEKISSLSYGEWAMKFVPIEKDMTRLLEQSGFKKFDPYRFDHAMVEKVITLLRRSTNPRTDAVVEKMIKESVATPPGDTTSKVGWPIAAALVCAVAAAGAIFLLR